MKKANLICIVLILACAVTFLGYRVLSDLQTDVKAPEIHIQGELALSVQEPREALLQGVTAKDDRDGDVTASLVVESTTMGEDGTVKVVYAAFDAAGNVARAYRRVTYSDYRGPRFSLRGPLVFSNNTSFDVLTQITAFDDMDGNITRRIRATSLTDRSVLEVGIHEVCFRVTNDLGDKVELTLPVEVVPAQAYQASLSLTDYLIYLDTGSKFNARDYLYGFTILDEFTYLRGSFPEELTLKISGTVDTSAPGIYPVSYTVTGMLREEPYTAYSKLIVIVEG